MFEGHVLGRQRRYAQAAERYSQTAGLFPNQGEPYRHRALAHLCLKEYAKAIEDYTTSVDMGGSGAIWDLYKRATPLRIVRRTNEAAQDCRAFLEHRSHVTRADARLFLILRGQADILQRQGR